MSFAGISFFILSPINRRIYFSLIHSSFVTSDMNLHIYIQEGVDTTADRSQDLRAGILFFNLSPINRRIYYSLIHSSYVTSDINLYIYIYRSQDLRAIGGSVNAFLKDVNETVYNVAALVFLMFLEQFSSSACFFQFTGLVSTN